MQDRAEVKIIPPLIPLTGLAAGGMLHWVWPLSVGPAWLLRPLGATLIASSVGLVLFAARTLVRARTAFDVRRPTTRLVAAGPFRISRNPVYLASIMLAWGIGLFSNALWVALAAIPSASLLCILVIRKEEAYLQAKFGAEYASYRAAVPRWF